MENLLKDILERNRQIAKRGDLADYIPALKKANKEDLAICIIDGDREYKIGDYNVKFTIQSISKVIALMLALMDKGERVFEKVDLEGTVDPFNSLYKLDFPHIDKPANPMMNAGAIATTAQIEGDRISRIIDLMREITGNEELKYNEEVYRSESETGDKNKAMAYLMKSRGIIEGSPEEALDHYFKQCSIEVTAYDLAKIGYFLANGCRGLKSYGKMDRVNLSKKLLAIMTIGGMYDFSGEYAANVGIPTKSGVGGGIMGAVPRKMGIGIFSPPLDRNGNSIAGRHIMEDLSRELELSIF